MQLSNLFMRRTMPIATYFVANGTSLRCKVTQNRLNYQTFLHKIMAMLQKMYGNGSVIYRVSTIYVP